MTEPERPSVAEELREVLDTPDYDYMCGPKPLARRRPTPKAHTNLRAALRPCRWARERRPEVRGSRIRRTP
jgi:hypothetical protein